ncbi:MAG TPA: LamG domain-containing protein [Candidatus Cloacimonadota bacterium]|nr:LamG domain-containing protein [Candidatus Cloacimonadota bacterium]HPS39719.1 LamG domain-containing protein [Candidatus Cloacimonadota bacterium]
MKKLLLFLIFFCVVSISFSQSKFKRGIQVGRLSGATNIDSITSAGTYLKVYHGATRITEGDVMHDTINNLLGRAEDAEAWFTSKMADFQGGGSGVGMYQLKGIVGTTSGFPGNGDSLVINTGFISHSHIQVFREGSLQWQNGTNAGQPDGFKFTQATGTITFKPVLSSGEQIIIQAYDPIIWHELVAEGGSGGGGGSGSSSLLTDLVLNFDLNETSGTTVIDGTGTQNGSTTATVNQAGKLGVAELFNDANDVIEVPYNASQATGGDDLTISVWVYFTSLPSALSHESYLARYGVTTSPWEAAYITIGTDNHPYFHVKNTSNEDYQVGGTTTFTTGNWYHITGVCQAGSAMKLYVGSTDVSTGAETFTGTILTSNSLIYFGNAYQGSGSEFRGYLDQCLIWNRDLSAGEVSTLDNGGAGRAYPFN